MNYEKKYNEALERAKKFEEKYGGGYAEYIFPELAESEDERIRKLLVWQVYRNIEDETNDLAQSVYDGIKGHDPDIEESIEDWKRCLAWLEKQKENPKTADSIPPDCTSDAKCEDRWHKVSDSLPDNPREVLCKDEAGNYFIGRYYTGEGWEISNYDDEDKPHHLNPPVSKWIDFPSEKQKEPENTSASTMAPSCWEVEQKEQKPKEKSEKPIIPEWSEEALNVMNLVYRCIRKVLAEFAVYTENEELLESREETVCYYSQRCAEKILKSLRPSWKPSEDELTKKHLEGYIKGRNDALREMSDFMESHFNTQSGTSIKSGGNE